MDPAFAGLLPNELAVRHFVNHKVTHEIGSSFTDLGRGIRKTIITIVVIKCSFDLVQAVLKYFRRGVSDK